jgi:quinohemoprotein amine dehydrogenase
MTIIRPMRIARTATACVMALTAVLAVAQETAPATPPATPAAKPEKPAEPSELGIPVTSELVIAKCGGCHRKDDKGNMSRISWERSTPEGWEEAIKRMVRLNGLRIAPPDAKAILKYLATNHGLAPEENKAVMYMAEHRIQDEVVPNELYGNVCATCHALGRVQSWRRTKEDWKLLSNMHIAFFSQAEQTFRSGCSASAPWCRPVGGGGGGGARPAPGTPPPTPSIDTINDFLGKNFGLRSPEWSAWQARMRAPKLAGRWLIAGRVMGKGKFSGEMVITPGATDDEFSTSITLTSLKDGSKIERTGSALVYTGHSWRGRSKTTAAAAGLSPDSMLREMREAMWVSPDQSYAEGRWFWGEYQEFGIDVKLSRVSSEPLVTVVDRWSLKAGSTGQRVKLIGENFPADAAAADLDFGTGVTVKTLVSKSKTELVAEVDVAATAVSGKRDVSFRRAILPSGIAIYDRVDYIKVTPESTLARLGSETHPKGYQQFEAIGYQRGSDGKPHTADDVELGVVEVSWSVEEYMSTYGDDDKEFVGTLNSSGFFTPSLDGPNPARKESRNNYGNIWVVGTAKDEKDKAGKLMVGRSYLVVTVPTYIRWDQPEVAQ